MTPLSCTVLGCGTSSGVPVLGIGWGKCDPANPKNLRTRCSILLQWQEKTEAKTEAKAEAKTEGWAEGREEEAQERGEERGEERGGLLRSLLIDSSPDCRAQLLRANVRRLDAVLYTHDHADHCHGIDDLKWMRGDAPIAAYMNASTLESLTRRFGYIFDSVSRPAASLYRPVLSGAAIEAWREFSPLSTRVSATASKTACKAESKTESKSAKILPMALDHGFAGEVLGFRLGDIAYTTDCVSLSERAFEALAGVRVWIVGCLRREEHPTHAHLSRVVGWAERVRAERVYLTHMNASMDYDRLCEELPSHIRPAYDFLRVSGEF